MAAAKWLDYTKLIVLGTKMANCFTVSWVLRWAISIVGPSWDSVLLEYDAVYIAYVYIYFAKSNCVHSEDIPPFFDYPEEVDTKLSRNFRDSMLPDTVPHPRRLKRTWTPLWYSLINTFFPLWRYGPTRAMASSFLRVLDHTQRRTTVGSTPMD